jgi:hypothetical protein
MAPSAPTSARNDPGIQARPPGLMLRTTFNVSTPPAAVSGSTPIAPLN